MRQRYYRLASAANPLEGRMSLSAWLMRPYFDLGPLERGPIHAESVACLAEEVLENPDTPAVPHQINTPTALRAALLGETGLREYDVRSPAELPEPLRTPAWQRLCDLVEQWRGLDEIARDNVTFLLSRLGFYETVLALVPVYSEEQISRSEAVARLACLRANALFKLSPANKRAAGDVLHTVARVLPRGCRSRLIAATNLVVHYARHLQDLEQVRTWCDVADGEALFLQPGRDPVDRLLASIYYRAVSFLPYMTGDRAETLHQLKLAMDWAEQVPQTTRPLKALHDENLHPLLETTAKTLMWAGDSDQALAVTRRLAEHDSLDPKPHLQVGDMLLERRETEQALVCYQQAAALGAPYTAVAWFKAGYALEKLGRAEDALDAYLQACRTDRFGVSPLQRAHELARRLNRTVVLRWSAAQLQRLGASAAG